MVAFALQDDGQVSGDDDFVFYNAPSSPDGGVRLTVDGACQQGIDIDVDALPDGCTRVRIAAAIDGDAVFGSVGPVRLSFTDADSGPEIAIATLDAATEERSLVLAEVYLRRQRWRVRAVGQGYEHGLLGLVEMMGVQVD